jgi:hypothetical protein
MRKEVAAIHAADSKEGMVARVQNSERLFNKYIVESSLYQVNLPAEVVSALAVDIEKEKVAPRA